MTQWKDISKKTNGSVWKVEVDTLSITVTNSHINNPDKWVLHCYELQMDTLDLGLVSTQSAEVAKYTAVALIKSRLRDLTSSLSKIK